MLSSILTSSEKEAAGRILILAALADGTLNEAERAEIKRLTEGLDGGLAQYYGQVLAGEARLTDAARALPSVESKELVYEMAAGVCNADQALTEAEEKFLTELRDALQLDPVKTAEVLSASSFLREAPPIIGIGNAQTPPSAGLDELIRDRAILAGALELMPQRLATMAIVPIQMRMVYQVGKAYGYELDLTHTREFFATVGLGLTSQVVEGYLSKFVGHVTRRFAGRIVGALATQAAESAVAFVTTYAIGQVAKTYYGSGRTLSAAQLRDTFSAMLNEGRSLQTRYASEISQRASSLRVSDFLPLGSK